MPTTDLHEVTLSDSQLRIDRDAGVIHNVKVLGSKSANNRNYSPNARQNARKLCEGIRVFLNHDRSKKSDRRIEDRFGILKENSEREAGNYADLHYLKSHPHADQIVEMADRFPETFGLSIDGEGELSNKGKQAVVESITNMWSVDVVSRPATNPRGLIESEEPQMADAKKKAATKKTIKEIVEQAGESEAKSVLVNLLEQDFAPETAEVEVEAEATDPMEELNKAIGRAMSAAVTQFTKGEMELGDLITKIRMFAKKMEKAENPGESVPAVPAEGDGEMSESEQKLLTRLNTIEAKNLLLESNREASDVRVAAVAALPESQRKALVESWEPKESKDGKKPPRPARSPAKFREGDGQPGSYEEIKESSGFNRKYSGEKQTA